MSKTFSAPNWQQIVIHMYLDNDQAGKFGLSTTRKPAVDLFQPFPAEGPDVCAYMALRLHCPSLRLDGSAFFQIVSCAGTRHPADVLLVKVLLIHASGSQTHTHESVSDGSCLVDIGSSAIELLACIALHGDKLRASDKLRAPWRHTVRLRKEIPTMATPL